jgi:hypothetical protein
MCHNYFAVDYPKYINVNIKRTKLPNNNKLCIAKNKIGNPADWQFTKYSVSTAAECAACTVLYT